MFRVITEFLKEFLIDELKRYLPILLFFGILVVSGFLYLGLLHLICGLGNACEVMPTFRATFPWVFIGITTVLCVGYLIYKFPTRELFQKETIEEPRPLIETPEMQLEKVVKQTLRWYEVAVLIFTGVLFLFMLFGVGLAFYIHLTE